MAPAAWTGTSEADTLTGSADADTIDGLGGDDLIRGLAGSDSLLGGPGNDRLEANAELDRPAADTLRGGDGSDTLVGALETASGGSGDLFEGGDGDDLLVTAGGWQSTLLGGAGDDTLQAGGRASSAVLSGGAGNDRLVTEVGWTYLSFTDSPQAVFVDLAAGTASGEGSDTIVGSFAGVDGSAFADTLTGAAGAQRLSGGEGDDLIRDNEGYNRLFGEEGNDTLESTGAAGSWLSGGDGDDRLQVAGNAVAEGGRGNDTVIGAADSYRLEGGDGDDEVRIGPAASGRNLVFARGDAGNDILMAEGDAARLDGGAGNDLLQIGGDGLLRGGDGDDTLVGGSGRSTLEGGAGRDSLVAGAGSAVVWMPELDVAVRVDLSREFSGEAVGGDLLSGRFAGFASGSGDDTLIGSAVDDVLWGGAGADLLEGAAGADRLKGQTGADTLRGGEGDDTYFVDSMLDVVLEAADEGIDRVQTGLVRYALPANVETLVFEPAWPPRSVHGWGHAGDNRIKGGLSNDRLFGAAGDDTLVGLTGNDLLAGGGGADSMRGGGGDDVYEVDQAGDVVVELPRQGRDTVRSSVSWTLPDAVENLVLTGVAPAAGRGNALSNAILGNDAGNLLAGFDGDDTLHGGAGADTLRGGLGDDVYHVDDPGDHVIEAAGEGVDRVVSMVSFRLPRHVERLDLSQAVGPVHGDGNALDNLVQGNRSANQQRGGDGADSLWGSGGKDTLLGGRGNDLLDGGLGDDVLHGGRGNDTLVPASGRDTLYGGPGDDTYVVDSVDVRIGEAKGAGRDLVQSRVSFVLGSNFEDLQLVGGGDRSGIGNGLDNLIQGGSGNDQLKGGAGNDTLAGGIGNDRLLGGNGRDELRMSMGQDTLSGGSGADLFVVTTDTGRDLVTDFSRGSDKLALVAASFGDRDDTIEGAVVVGDGQRFSSLAELVILDIGYSGPLGAVAEGAVIGDASEGFRIGRTVLFVVGNGAATGLFSFRAADADALVEPHELTYLGQLGGVPALALDDFLLSPQQIETWWG